MHETTDTEIIASDLTLYCEGATVEIDDARFSISFTCYPRHPTWGNPRAGGLEFSDCRAELLGFTIGSLAVTRAMAVKMASEAEVRSEEDRVADEWAAEQIANYGDAA